MDLSTGQSQTSVCCQAEWPHTEVHSRKEGTIFKNEEIQETQRDHEFTGILSGVSLLSQVAYQQQIKL